MKQKLQYDAQRHSELLIREADLKAKINALQVELQEVQWDLRKQIRAMPETCN